MSKKTEDTTDDAPDFTEIVAQKMVAEQRQQLRAEQARQAAPDENFELREAAYIFEHLKRRIKEFQKSLEGTEEIGLQLANFGLAAQLHVRAITYQNPNLIEFHGLDSKGNKVSLIQHVDQLNFMLLAVKPVKEEPYRIGFLEDVNETPENEVEVSADTPDKS